jgi:hypothetical protein
MPPMRTFAVASLFAALAAAGCKPPEINREEVKTQFFTEKGAFAGYDFGDSWEDVKKKHDAIYKVRDEKGFEQLRRDLSDPGSEGYYLGFSFDKDGKMTSLGGSVYGSQQNAVTVRMILDDAIEHYDKTIGKGRCTKVPGGQGNSTTCDWAAPGKPRVHAMYLEYTDPIRGSLDITLEPPGK